MSTEYSIEFYVSYTGNELVRKQLDRLDVRSRAKVLRTLKLIQVYGLSHIIPQLRKIASTPLWELRVLGKDNIRIICCKDSSKSIVVLYVYVKKSRKIPLNILEVALIRYNEIDI